MRRSGEIRCSCGWWRALPAVLGLCGGCGSASLPDSTHRRDGTKGLGKMRRVCEASSSPWPHRVGKCGDLNSLLLFLVYTRDSPKISQLYPLLLTPVVNSASIKPHKISFLALKSLHSACDPLCSSPPSTARLQLENIWRSNDKSQNSH